MLLIGVDSHPSFQQIAFFEEETGECGERQLNHSDGEAGRFYRGLQQRGICVRVGMEATGYSRWFERQAGSIGFRLCSWVFPIFVEQALLPMLLDFSDSSLRPLRS
jgi:transposase